jgi:hypothetical protein
MKKPLLILSFGIFLFQTQLLAQTSTFERAYQIMQTHCASPYCHGNGGQAAGLNLEGAGATQADKMNAVYTNLVGQVPSNATASAAGDHLIYKGRPDKSFLFRKINNGLEGTISLHANEGDPMPKGGATAMTDVEKELIRQWILFGAPSTGEVVKEVVLQDYYENGLGAEAFPNGAPAAPSPSEGFQLKMGPFFLGKQNNAQGIPDEVEFFQKWELDFPADQEITRIDTKMGTYSHHFIMYSFDAASGANSVPAGLRLSQNHNGISLVEAIQEPTDLKLPQGSAFSWDNDIVLDLNSHYINYDVNTVYKAEVYVNIYTQPSGTAAQEMFTVLVANPNIYIPNNGNPYTFTQPLTFNFGEVYVWSMMGHTHKWGTGYDVYLRNANGSKGEHIYDGACPKAIPGCATPFFDYQHIPMRFYDPLKPIMFNSLGGIIHEASYVNTGTVPVTWGGTSDDEMMVLVFMGMSDTTGVVTDVNEVISNPLDEIKVFPNPATNQAYIVLPEGVQNVNVTLHDMLGKVIYTNRSSYSDRVLISRNDLPSGVYLYRVEDEKGHVKTGKVIFQ